MQRRFLPQNFTVQNWESLQPFLDELQQRKIENANDLEKWLLDRSELESVLEEDMAWRYIRMTCDTTNESHTQAFQFFVTEIEPQLAPYSDAFNKKVIESPFAAELKGSGYAIFLRSLKKEVEIFREKNIALFSEMQVLQQQYGAISGAMSVSINGKEMTLQQAGVLLQETDRNLRETVYQTIQSRRLEDKEKLDDLLNKLIALRHQIAVNAGFDNYRDYMFKAMGRFDYTKQDVFAFHEAVAEAVVPVLNKLTKQRKEKLDYATLRPWDLSVDAEQRPPLKPFSTGKELLEKSITAFEQLHPLFGECLKTMQSMNRLDLESRKGKAPGGYNYPLDETGIPFIFMNATSTLRDLVTLMHEGGHAVHSILTKDLPLNFYKHTPSEVAELASMSMELISMDAWHLFFENEKDLKRAKIDHLAQIIETLPWVATVDKFQHWLYENPTHSVAERTAAWNNIYETFSSNIIDWSGLEKYKANIWQKQLHIYEVPFYYIEYGIAQLGAVAVWKNYKENPQKALQQYIDALRLGYTADIKTIYQTAGIRFDFSKNYIQELMQFVQNEIEKC